MTLVGGASGTIKIACTINLTKLTLFRAVAMKINNSPKLSDNKYTCETVCVWLQGFNFHSGVKDAKSINTLHGFDRIIQYNAKPLFSGRDKSIECSRWMEMKRPKSLTSLLKINRRWPLRKALRCVRSLYTPLLTARQ